LHPALESISKLISRTIGLNELGGDLYILP